MTGDGALAERYRAARKDGTLVVLAMAGPTTVVGTMSEATQLVESAAHLATTPYLDARLAYQRGVLAMRAGDSVQAVSQFEASLPRLETAGDEVTLRAALQNLGLLYMQAGDLSRAELHLVARQEVDVERVETLHAGGELAPRPGRDSTAEPLRTLRGVPVAELHPVVRLGDDPHARLEIEPGHWVSCHFRGS